jgi:hypothetical protein
MTLDLLQGVVQAADSVIDATFWLLNRLRCVLVHGAEKPLPEADRRKRKHRTRAPHGSGGASGDSPSAASSRTMG